MRLLEKSLTARSPNKSQSPSKPQNRTQEGIIDSEFADEAEFEYDRILAKRTLGPRVDYRVRWSDVWYSFKKNEQSAVLSLKQRNEFLQNRRPLVVHNSTAGIGRILESRKGNKEGTIEFKVEYKPSWLESRQFKDRTLIDEFERNRPTQPEDSAEEESDDESLIVISSDEDSTTPPQSTRQYESYETPRSRRSGIQLPKNKSQPINRLSSAISKKPKKTKTPKPKKLTKVASSNVKPVKSQSNEPEEDDFEFDKILGKRTVNGRVEYQVHWADVWYGFGKSEESKVLSLKDRNKFLQRGTPLNVQSSSAGVLRILESRRPKKGDVTEFKVEFKPSWLPARQFHNRKLINEFEKNQAVGAAVTIDDSDEETSSDSESDESRIQTPRRSPQNKKTPIRQSASKSLPQRPKPQRSPRRSPIRSPISDRQLRRRSTRKRSPRKSLFEYLSEGSRPKRAMESPSRGKAGPNSSCQIS